MKKMTVLFILFIILVFAGQVFAGPAVNAQEFQAKAVKQALRPDGVQSQAPAGEVITEASGESAGDVSAKAPEAEPVKTQVTVSQQVIDQQMIAYKGNLKEIVKEAENNLKKIDGELKDSEAGKAVAEHISAANTLSAEGKYEEARAELKAALALADTPKMKKNIKEKQRAIDQQADQVESRNQQAAQAAKEIQQKSKKQVDQQQRVVEKNIVKKGTQAQARQKPVQQNFTQKNAPAKVQTQQNFIQKNAPVKVQAAKPVEISVAEKAKTEAAAKARSEEAAKRAADEAAAAKAKMAAEQKTADEAAAAKVRSAAEQKAIDEVAVTKTQAEEAVVKTQEAAQKVEQVTIPQTAAPTIPTPAATAQAPAAAAAAEDAVSAMYREAVSLYWDGKYSESRAKFEQVQKASPEYARTNYYLGRIKEKLGNSSTSEEVR